MRIVVRVLLIGFLTFVGTPSSLFTPISGVVASPVQLRAYVDAATTVTGPNDLTDNPYNTLRSPSGLIAYLANGDTQAFSVDTSGALNLIGPALTRGASGSFDQCGAWLNSTYLDSAVIRGWYHAEGGACGSGDLRTVGYAESRDGGRTFTKPANNQVITAPMRFQQDATDASEGDQHVIQIGSWFYMYFVAQRCHGDAVGDYACPSGTDRTHCCQIRLARSPVAGGGLPGTWEKYCHYDANNPQCTPNNEWNQNGEGGESSPIAPDLLSRTWVSYSTSLGLYVGVGYNSGGYSIATSMNGISWSLATALVLADPAPGFYNRPATAGELTDYPSFIGLDGDSRNIADTFWLYYLEIPPFTAVTGQRNLVRRQVHLIATDATDALALTPRIALTRYQRTKSANIFDTWVTTTNADPRFQLDQTLGYLFTTNPSASGYLPVYDCYLVQEDDHMLSDDQGQSRNAQLCENPAYYGTTVKSLRMLGWVATASFPNAQPIYRCFEPLPGQTYGNHFVWTDASCNGKTLNYFMGYIESSLVLQPPNPQPSPHPTVTIGTPSIPDPQPPLHPVPIPNGIATPLPQPLRH